MIRKATDGRVVRTVENKRNGAAKQFNPEILDAVPPHDLDAERGVIGSLILDLTILPHVASIVNADDFHADAHRRLFAHLAAMYAKRHDYGDITLLVDRLKESGEYEAIGGAAYLAEVGQSVPYTHNAVHYARIVKKKSRIRSIRLASQELLTITSVDCDDATVDESLDRLRRIRQADVFSPVAFIRLVADNPALRSAVIEGLLRTGETMNLVAASKARKSWLTYSLALSVISGGKWLDTFACTPGRVLIIDGELHSETIVSRIRAVADAMQVEQGYDQSFDVLPLRGKGIDLLGLASIIDGIEPGRYALVILDAWYRFLPAKISENDNAAVMLLYNTIDSYTSRLGSAWLNVHHASKGDQSGKGVIDVGSGAGSQSRAADSHLVIRPHREDDVAVIEAVVRSWPPVDAFCVRWNHPAWQRDDEADPRHLWTPQTARERAKDGRESHLDEDRQAVVNAMVALGRPETKTEIRTASGIGDNKRFDNALGSLIRDKTVKAASVTKGNNRNYEGYEIAPG